MNRIKNRQIHVCVCEREESVHAGCVYLMLQSGAFGQKDDLERNILIAFSVCAPLLLLLRIRECAKSHHLRDAAADDASSTGSGFNLMCIHCRLSYAAARSMHSS
jgi:hypothetical protein